MCNKKNLLVATVAILGAALLVITQTAGTVGKQQSNKLEGAWISTVPGTPMLGNIVFSPTDPSGRRAALTGQVTIGVGVPRSSLTRCPMASSLARRS